MSDDWIREYFEHGYARRWALAPPTRQVQHDVSGLWTLRHLSPRARVLDVGCGHRRHALAFASHGAEVTGIDFAATLLRRAKDLATTAGMRVP